MDFLIGSLVTFGVLLFASLNAQKRVQRLGRVAPIRYSQSYIFKIIRPFLSDSINYKPLVTQATRYEDRSHMRVFIDLDTAYWIRGNRLYSAEVFDGIILQETEKEVDTMVVNKVELDKLTFIVEKLTEGLSNDSGSAGNQNL